MNQFQRRVNTIYIIEFVKYEMFDIIFYSIIYLNRLQLAKF